MSEYIDKNEAVGEGYLADWYIHSVAEYGDEKLNEPRWTEKHIEELTQDFIVIPKDTPAADVAPVVHGEWLNIEGDYTFAACSICETAYEVATEEEAEKGLWDAFMCSYRYCPNCGAKMDGKERQNNE